jgi:CHASE3 domain sensor protein
MSVLTVGRPLREKLGDDAVDSLIALLNQALNDQKNDILKFVEEKFERRLTEEISGVNRNLSEVESKLMTQISQVKSDLMAKNVEMIRWMFIFWVGQVGVILGILFAFFKS